jgi:hypothetical protein
VADASSAPYQKTRWNHWIWRFSWLGSAALIYVLAVFILMWVKNDAKPTLTEQLERLNQLASWSGTLDGQPIYYTQPALLRIDKPNSTSYLLARNGTVWSVDPAQQQQQKLPAEWAHAREIDFAVLFGLPKTLDLAHLRPMSHVHVEEGIIWSYQLGEPQYELTITLDNDDYQLRKIEIRDERPNQPAKNNHLLLLATNNIPLPPETFELKNTAAGNGLSQRP